MENGSVNPDGSSLLYPYPHNFNVANCVTTKLDATNFLFWEMQIINMVEGQGMMGFLDGTFAAPAPSCVSVIDGSTCVVPNPVFAAWKRSDRLLKGWLISTLSTAVKACVLRLEISAEVWNALHKSVALSGEDREMMLHTQLQNMSRSKYKTLSEYLTAFKLVCDELHNLDQPLPDNRKMYWCLNGLNDDYAMFKTTMIFSPCAYDKMVSKLVSFEYRCLKKSDVTEENNTRLSSMAFLSDKNMNHVVKEEVNYAYQPQQFGRNRFGRGRRGRYNGYRGRNAGYRQRFSSNVYDHNSVFSSNQRGFQPTQLNGHASGIPNNPDMKPVQLSLPKNASNNYRAVLADIKCQLCFKKGHTAAKCWERYNQDFLVPDLQTALAALQVNDDSMQAWIPDFNATLHMSENPDLMDK